MLAIAVPMMLGPLAGSAQWPVLLAVAASAAYVANWASVLDVGALGPIIHTWSLSIEEQFYLVWPAAFVVLCRANRSLARWLAGGAALVVLTRLLGWDLTFGVWPYFATVTHADGLLVGALLAVGLDRLTFDGPVFDGLGRPVQVVVDAVRRHSRWVARAGVVTLAGLGATLSVVDGATYVGGLTLAVMATAAVVGHVVPCTEGKVALSAG